jgi:hypothetical protein
VLPAGSRLLVLNPLGVDEAGREVPLEAVKKNVLGFTQVGCLGVKGVRVLGFESVRVVGGAPGGSENSMCWALRRWGRGEG